MLEGKSVKTSSTGGDRPLHSSGGKQRTKVEVQLNSQHKDVGGDTRKIVTAMMNQEKNHNQQQQQPHPQHEKK